MATSLSGPLSDTGGCLISQRFALATVSGLCKNLERNHPFFACSVAPRFAAPMVSLPPYQFTRDPLDESEKDVLSSGLLPSDEARPPSSGDGDKCLRPTST